jgi:hypothetical protein
VITSTSASSVGETTATLEGALDPNGANAKAHFEYLTEAEYLTAGNSFTGAATAPAKDITVENQAKGTGSAEAGSGVIRGVSTEKGSFAPGQTIKTPGVSGVLPPGTTIVFVGADPDPNSAGKLLLVLSANALKTEAGVTFTATGGAATGSGDISSGSTQVKNLNTASGTFNPGQAISGPGIAPNTTIETVPSATELILSRGATETATVVPLTAASGQPVSAIVEGLVPQTKYRFRLLASHTGETPPATGPTQTLYTLASVPSFPDCPSNEPFRSGTFAPFGHPSDALPDCRAYEQASPVNKNGGDVLGEVQFSKAADDGSSVTFGSSFGVPGAEAAQERPFYLATRGGGDWTTTGLMPPPSAGDKAQPLAGWSPDFENAYAIAIRPREGFRQALFELHRDGSAPIQITPFALGGSYFAGTSKDVSTVITEFSDNVHAWNRATEELHLASVMNMPEETEGLLPKGAFAGPYDWMNKDTNSGGALSNYYLRDERAVSTDGSVFFTAAGSGQLYQRLNPTAEQSNPGPNGYVEDGHCFEPAKACTIHISATEKTNGGPAEDGPDPAGPQPAAFQAASADGSVSYFTSSEKLTNDANTGPEQPPAQIGVADLSDPDPNATKDESFLPTHAKGLATSPDGEYLYWVDPSKNSVGRVNLNPDGSHGPVEDDFIVPEPTEYEPDPEGEPGVTEETPSVPQYVAVGPCAEGGECVYWTDRGPLDDVGSPMEGDGSIGRVRLDSSGGLGSADSEFITGASNPQGIAVDSGHVYWANSGRAAGTRAIGRASIAGDEVDQQFHNIQGNEWYPFGVALNETHVFFSAEDRGNDIGFIGRFPLAGPSGVQEDRGFGTADVRSVAVDSSYIYWASRSEHAIGRVGLSLLEGATEPSFLPVGGKPDGLALAGERIHFSVNGEAPTNPGKDLYRHTSQGHDGCHEPAGCLEDLTADAADPDGAEVQGVLGASADGEYVYFAANGDLDVGEPAQDGDCAGSNEASWKGRCSIYLWHDGDLQFVSTLDLGDSNGPNLTQTPIGIGSTSSYLEKTSFVSADGQILVFREGGSDFYRFGVGQGVSCLTCAPSGERGAGGVLQSAKVNNGLAASLSSSVQSHHLSADGNRFFFESSSALVAGDINGVNGCPSVGSGNQEFFSCQDVYEWEASGSGTCTEGGPAYSPANQGCLYLISTGTSKYPSFFVDASSSGDDVFFLTRDQLVGQDTDQLQDVYDARVDGGLAMQNPPPPIPCENEGCKNESPPTPQFSAPPQISGPGNPPVKRKPCKPKKGKTKGCSKKGKPRHHKRHHHKGAKR